MKINIKTNKTGILCSLFIYLSYLVKGNQQLEIEKEFYKEETNHPRLVNMKIFPFWA